MGSYMRNLPGNENIEVHRVINIEEVDEEKET